MPPSVVLVASACESPSPGASGSSNGNCVAGTVGVDGASDGAACASDGAAPTEAGSSSDGALLASGDSGLTRIVGVCSSPPPLTTYSAGCSSVGPPRGMSATARWRPGGSDDGAGPNAPPATGSAPSDGPSTTAPATQLPFKLPDKPGEGDSQALATNTTDGGIVYDVAYSLVTVKDGAPVKNENSAYALASCDACTTLAVSFQLVLIVGQSDRIMPINVAEALNLNCPECITTAIAKQIVISVTSEPSPELLRRLTEELQKLDAIDTSDPPAEVLQQVNAVSEGINRALEESGITYPKAIPTPGASATPAPSQGSESTPEPSSGTATPAPTPTATPTESATPTPTESPTPTPTETATPSPTP